MAENEGIYKLKQVQRRYIGYQLVADVLFATALTIIINSILFAFLSVSLWWSTLVFAAIFVSLSVFHKPWQITIAAIASFLDLQYPHLEESCSLVLKPNNELNFLEQLQLSKVENALQHIPTHQGRFTGRLKFGILFLVVALLLGFGITCRRVKWQGENSMLNPQAASQKAAPENIPPQIESVSLAFIPPAYTGKPQSGQDKFAIEIEEGGLIKWRLKLNTTVKRLSLLFNEKERVPLKNTGGVIWTAQKAIVGAGFYQVDIDGALSDLYPVQVIRDNPPVIRIKTPQQYTYIDAGESKKVQLSAIVNDDYGISDAFIQATIARGSGEAVKFKEQKISFDMSFNGRSRQSNLNKTLDLAALSMEPGDELYFYIQAQDNHRQQSRTDVYIVSIQDTAQLMSMDGLLSGVNIKPEFFRSERQIILDSEQLLKEKDSLKNDKFQERSNELGNDQKLLRLRYGKFLGEEAESEVGDPHANREDAVSDINNFGNAGVILDKYADKHDNAEDAQFFDPGIKAQLKATLTEMWKAELQLRLYKPNQALPFEYKALRLLKDLQQKSRSYVAKTAYNPAPLKMEKRLTGDLSKIVQPVNRQDIKADKGQLESLKGAVTVLEGLKTSPLMSIAGNRALQLANQQLIAGASARPEVYLPAVSAIRRILSAGNNISSNDIGLAEKAIQRILPAAKPLPKSLQNAPDMGLSQGYFKNLNRLNK